MTSGCSPIQTYMDPESYRRGYTFLSTEGLSGPSANTSNPAPFPPQGTPVLDEGRSDLWSSGITDPQVDTEAYFTSLRPCPSSHSTSLPIDTAGVEIPIAASNIRGNLSWVSPKLTLRGSHGSGFVSVISNEDSRDNIVAEADINRNLRQGSMSMNTLDHGPQYPKIHTTSDPSVLSAIPDSYSLPTVVPYQERASKQILQQPQNLGNDPTGASSRSPLKPDRFRCSVCGLDFAQKRGVTRHYRDVHEVSLCLHCSGFKWHRRHELQGHLEEEHPDVHVPAALADATRYRRRATMSKNRRQEQQYYQWGLNEPLPQPLTPPLPPAPEVTHVSSPAMSCVTYDPPPELIITNVTRRQDRAPPRNAVDVPSWGRHQEP